MICDDSGVIAAGSIAVADCQGDVRARRIVEDRTAGAGEIPHALAGAVEIQRATVDGQRAAGRAKRS